MESKTLDFTGMKIPRDYHKRKEEYENGRINQTRRTNHAVHLGLSRRSSFS